MIRADRIVNHGTIDADALQGPPFTPNVAPCDPPYQPPTVNSGGGHGSFGGHGSNGIGGSPYDQCHFELSSLDAPGINPGAPGAGTGPGGRDGGVIVLISNGLLVSDGEISADGQDGEGNTGGGCASGGNPNTGTPGPRAAAPAGGS